MLATRSRARPKADWKAEKMPLKMPERISKKDETRLERPEAREDMVVSVVACFVLEGKRVGEYDVGIS